LPLGKIFHFLSCGFGVAGYNISMDAPGKFACSIIMIGEEEK